MTETLGINDATLVLRFENRRPIKATALSKVLRDLSSDYKRAYRDELVVTINQGSLILRLRALAKSANSANHLIDFGKNVALIVSTAAAGYAAFAGHLSLDPNGAFKAAESITKLAVDSQSQMEISYESSGKEKLVVKVTPLEARVANVQISKAVKASRSPSKTPSAAGGIATIPDIALKRRLLSLDAKPGGLTAVSHEVLEVVQALVLELHRAAPNRINDLIKQLEAEGHSNAAQLIRRTLAARKRPLED